MADNGTNPPMDLPSHTKGVMQGNALGSYDKSKGHKPDGTSTAERSTGVDSSGSEPIDPSMPNLSPA